GQQPGHVHLGLGPQRREGENRGQGAAAEFGVRPAEQVVDYGGYVVGEGGRRIVRRLLRPAGGEWTLGTGLAQHGAADGGAQPRGRVAATGGLFGRDGGRRGGGG